MGEQLKKTHEELLNRMKKYDEALVQMINVRTRDTILKILRDYLSQHES